MKWRNSGFTLMEVVFGLVCLVILLLISGTTWRHYDIKIHQTIMTHRVQDALAYARNMAVLHQHDVLFCGSSDGMHCDGLWNDGQMIKDMQSGKVLQVYSVAKSPLNMSYHANFGRNKQVVFTPLGFTRGQEGHFSICADSDPYLATHCSVLIVHFSGGVVLG